MLISRWVHFSVLTFYDAIKIHFPKKIEQPLDAVSNLLSR